MRTPIVKEVPLPQHTVGHDTFIDVDTSARQQRSSSRGDLGAAPVTEPDRP